MPDKRWGMHLTKVLPVPPAVGLIAAMTLRSSLVRRYFMVTLAVWGVSIAAVSLLYDRYASGLLDQLLGEKLNAHLTAAAGRLGSFLDVRNYELETLSNHPMLPAYMRAAPVAMGGEVAELLRVEADVPDLYGVLFLSDDNLLRAVVAGQAASGAPYWGGTRFDLSELPVVTVGETDFVGPAPAINGQAGWFLMRQSVAQGGIALHVRLSSLTELLGTPPAASMMEPLLKTPTGYFDAVGQQVFPRGELVPGPEVVPGWRPVLHMDSRALISPLQAARGGLYLAILLAVAASVMLFSRLAARLQRRLAPLSHGAQAIARGELDHRVPVRGEDEIAMLSDSFNAMATRIEGMVAEAVRMERMVALGEFATAIAHEVRNPMATLKTSAQALARREADAERRALLDDMVGEIDRLGRVMQDLLEYGRPRQAEPRPVAARELLRRAQSLMAPTAAHAQVSLNAQGDADLVVLADADQIQQVLVNLLLNALDATPPGGLVSLRVFRGGNHGEIEVRDTGRGIPDALLDKVMQPFFTTKPSGTGLGLAICRQLVELNGGGMRIVSSEGQGTTIRLSLPLPEEVR